MADNMLYEGREQTLVKHLILQKYLERFAHKVGTKWDCLTYVDCFAGPWNTQSPDFSDSSFAIAITELKKARQTQIKAGRELKLRCFFLEKDHAAYEQLRQFAAGIAEVEIVTENRELEDSIDQIVHFVKGAGGRSFPFIFIDPKGWSGFALNTIKPLLTLNPVEILVNFMTGHIRRFLESPQEQTQESFAALFGSSEFQSRIEGLSSSQKEDEAVRLYSSNLQRAGGFPYVSTAIVLHPQINRTHFHLIHATRHPAGAAVFKEVEKKAMHEMESARARAQQNTRVKRRSQTELFSAKVMSDSHYYDGLRDRYLGIAQKKVFSEIKSQRQVLYDALWHIAAGFPLVWESDLKQWIREWVETKLIAPPRLASNQRSRNAAKETLLFSDRPLRTAEARDRNGSLYGAARLHRSLFGGPLSRARICGRIQDSRERMLAREVIHDQRYATRAGGLRRSRR